MNSLKWIGLNSHGTLLSFSFVRNSIVKCVLDRKKPFGFSACSFIAESCLRTEYRCRKRHVNFVLPSEVSLVTNSENVGFERRNEFELPPRQPTRPKERSNGFCATGHHMLRLCLFLACAAAAMGRALLGDDRSASLYSDKISCKVLLCFDTRRAQAVSRADPHCERHPHHGCPSIGSRAKESDAEVFGCFETDPERQRSVCDRTQDPHLRLQASFRFHFPHSHRTVARKFKGDCCCCCCCAVICIFSVAKSELDCVHSMKPCCIALWTYMLFAQNSSL